MRWFASAMRRHASSAMRGVPVVAFQITGPASKLSKQQDVRRLAMVIDFWCIAMNRASVFYHLVEHTSVTYHTQDVGPARARTSVGPDTALLGYGHGRVQRPETL
eukprot:jgi/Ulvmu1/3863/UM018_0082.1